MNRFDAAPAIPINYHRLQSLTQEEVDQARSAGYVLEIASPSDLVQRNGLNNYDKPYLEENIFDWRIRMYIIWFCYIYENFNLIQKPLGAIEEILLEFKAPEIIDLPGRRLATLYAGVGYVNCLSEDGVAFQLLTLKPHYEKGIHLLKKFDQSRARVEGDVTV